MKKKINQLNKSDNVQVGQPTSLPDEGSDNPVCITCKTFSIYKLRVMRRVTWCFTGNQTVTPTAFGERAQNLCWPLTHHKIKSSRLFLTCCNPSALECEGRHKCNYFCHNNCSGKSCDKPLVLRKDVLCLQPADICKLLLQRCP